MKFKIDDKLISKVNAIFKGYYLVIDKDETHYILMAQEDGTDDHFEYKRTIKWVEKNMYLKPEEN